jgi:hypothetical protein
MQMESNTAWSDSWWSRHFPSFNWCPRFILLCEWDAVQFGIWNVRIHFSRYPDADQKWKFMHRFFCFSQLESSLDASLESKPFFFLYNCVLVSGDCRSRKSSGTEMISSAQFYRNKYGDKFDNEKNWVRYSLIQSIHFKYLTKVTSSTQKDRCYSDAITFVINKMTT